jgi:hypothetical protein
MVQEPQPLRRTTGKRCRDVHPSEPPNSGLHPSREHTTNPLFVSPTDSSKKTQKQQENKEIQKDRSDPPPQTKKKKEQKKKEENNK